jgi:hypothetical protein
MENRGSERMLLSTNHCKLDFSTSDILRGRSRRRSR